MRRGWPFLVLLAVAQPAAAQDGEELLTIRSGAWTTIIAPAAAEAFTAGEGETSIGVLCMRSCWFYFNAARPCVAERAYAGALETGAARLELALTCHAENGMHAFLAPAAVEMLDLFAAADAVRVSVGVEGAGDSAVTTFPLDGALEAIAIAADAAAAAYETEGPESTETSGAGADARRRQC